MDGEANDRIRGAAQGFIAFILWGVGAFVGTMLAGRVLAARQLPTPIGTIEHDWRGIWMTPALGAVAVLRREGERPLSRRARSDGSYLSANDPRILFGLGQSVRPGVLDVRWPDGRRERFRDLGLDRYLTLRQGQGEPVP